MLKLCFLLCPIPVAEKIEEIYKAFVQESGIHFSELEEQVLQFHLSNLEYACGSDLHQVGLRFEARSKRCWLLCMCVYCIYLHIELVLVWINRK